MTEKRRFKVPTFDTGGTYELELADGTVLTLPRIRVTSRLARSMGAGDIIPLLERFPEDVADVLMDLDVESELMPILEDYMQFFQGEKLGK